MRPLCTIKLLKGEEIHLLDELQERYVFYRLAHTDFEECLQILSKLPKIEDAQVKLALVKYAIVSYYRPFSGSNPVHRERKWKLDEALVTDMETHDAVKRYRMHLIAHSDLEYRQPSLGRTGGVFPISYKGFYYEEYMHIVQPLENLATSMWSIMGELITAYETDHF